MNQSSFSSFHLKKIEKLPSYVLVLFTGLIPFISHQHAHSQEIQSVQINTGDRFQAITGFGASLAYYEGWLTAHPYRTEIYDVIFGELSLDILRVRNAYGYDPGMVGRVKQFSLAARNSLGHPIDILSTSWSPAGYVKSNNDHKNGGTIRYTVENGKVVFDYAAFASWWKESINEYHRNGIYPKYISIQNEPDWKASYESCLLQPSEKITSTDTIAGYNKALDAVYDTLMKLENPPLFLGPECIGIGYNAVENYVNKLDLSKLHGIGHHLYHGAEGGTVANDPFTSANYSKVGNFHPEVPHFQTEYSRADWFSVAAMMYMTLAVENATAFLYWDLIWTDGKGLVNLEFPWDRNRWTTPKGYYRTKDFFVFKHFSGFIHPGWVRIGASAGNNQLKSAAFLSPSADSAAFVVINRSLTDSFTIRLEIPGFSIHQATAYTTDAGVDFWESDYLRDTVLTVPPKSINTIDLRLAKLNTGINSAKKYKMLQVSCYPNPFDKETTITFESAISSVYSIDVFDISGKRIASQKQGYFPAGKNQFVWNRNQLEPGIYFYKLTSGEGLTGSGRFIIAE